MSIILNGTTGITTPGINNTGAFTFGGAIDLPGGTVGAPSLTTTGDLDTGIYFPAANQIAISTAGTQRVFVGATGDVGIGTGSPQNDSGYGGLTVNGSSGSIITLRAGGSNSGRIYTTGTDNINIDANGTASTNILFRTGTSSTERARIDAAGNFGLGVTPSAWSTGGNLQLSNFGSKVDGISFANNAYFDSGWKYASNGFAGLYSQVSSQHIFYTAASGTAGNSISLTQAMTLDASGNLGIGTTGPGTKLDVRGVMYVPAANFKAVAQLYSTDSQAAGNGAGLTLGGVFTSTSVTSFAQIAGIKENSTDNNYAGALAFYSRPNGDTLAERARITSDGSFQITQTPGKYTVDTSPGATSIANNGTANFPNASGMLVVNNWTNGNVTIYLCGGGSTVAVSSVGSQVGTFAYDAGINGYIWTNNTGSTATFGFFFVRTRSNA